MIKRTLSLLAFVMFAIASTVSHAQDPIALNIGPNGYNCGRLTANYYCYGIPLTVGVESGTMWTDYSGVNTAFIQFSGAAAYLGSAHITSKTTGTDYTGVAYVSFQFSGTTTSGKAYTGGVQLNYYTYYSQGGGGKGGAGAGWRWVASPVGSSLLIQMKPTASPNSPIAPTPLCLDKTVGHCTDPQ